jgi:hypothetical protein
MKAVLIRRPGTRTIGDEDYAPPLLCLARRCSPLRVAIKRVLRTRSVTEQDSGASPHLTFAARLSSHAYPDRLQLSFRGGILESHDACDPSFGSTGILSNDRLLPAIVFGCRPSYLVDYYLGPDS